MCLLYACTQLKTHTALAALVWCGSVAAAHRCLVWNGSHVAAVPGKKPDTANVDLFGVNKNAILSQEIRNSFHYQARNPELKCNQHT